MNEKTTKKATISTPENALAFSTKEQQKDVVTLNNALNNLFPVDKVTTIYEANYLIKSAFAISEKVSLPIAKLFQRVRTEKMFVEKFKTFNDWALKTFNLKKASANAYAKIGDYITEDGKKSILPTVGEKDYGYSQLVVIAESLTAEQAIESAKNGTITPFMTIKELKKALKGDKNDITDEVTDESTTTEEAAEEVTEEATEEAAEEEKDRDYKAQQATFTHLYQTLINADIKTLRKINEFLNKIK